MSYKNWHIPFHEDQMTLSEALDSLSDVKADQSEIPLMIQLVENPKFKIPGFEIFHGAVDIQQHDCIHILLGRGLLNMDEAFTIGFTMGSTKKVTTTEESLYAFVSKHLYPDVYRFNQEEIAVFKDAVKLAYISNCVPLDKFDFSDWLDQPLRVIREVVGVEPELINAYFAVEERRYPLSVASQRLLPQSNEIAAY